MPVLFYHILSLAIGENIFHDFPRVLIDPSMRD
jgi:hypothetical protein